MKNITIKAIPTICIALIATLILVCSCLTLSVGDRDNLTAFITICVATSLLLSVYVNTTITDYLLMASALSAAIFVTPFEFSMYAKLLFAAFIIHAYRLVHRSNLFTCEATEPRRSPEEFKIHKTEPTSKDEMHPVVREALEAAQAASFAERNR